MPAPCLIDRAFRRLGLVLLAVVLFALVGPPAFAADGAVADRASLLLPALDPAKIQRDDEQRAAAGRTAHFAVARTVDVEPWTAGEWELLDGNRARWRLRVRSLGALSLSLAFDRFEPTPGTRLWIEGARPGTADRLGPLTRRSVVATAGGTAGVESIAVETGAPRALWTPPLEGDELLLELTVPLTELDRLDLRLRRVHHGYAGVGETLPSGSCHPHAACAEIDPWADATRAVGLLTVDGVRYCTGFLLNNTARDRRPLLATARHCGLDAETAASLVVVWNRRQESCDRETATGTLAAGAESEPVTEPSGLRFQSGATLLATAPGRDLVLLELDHPAPDDAVFLGWDRSDDDPRRAAALHHPNADALRVAVTEDLRTTRHLRDRATHGGDHLRAAWSEGSTEGGSSGAPLVDELGRVVGLLRGGHAACGRDGADWFVRLSAAWDAGQDPARRLRDWLDPAGTEALVLDSLAPRRPARMR